MTVTATGTPSGGVVALEGSLDGSNYVALGSAVTVSSAGTTQVTVTNALVRFLRGHVTTAISGTGSPTVTVSVGLNG